MIGITIHLADSRQQALREIVPLYEEHAKMFAPLGFMPGMTSEQIAAVGRRGSWYKSGVPEWSTTSKRAAGSPAPLRNWSRSSRISKSDIPGSSTSACRRRWEHRRRSCSNQYRRVAAEVMPHFRRRPDSHSEWPLRLRGTTGALATDALMRENGA